MWQKQTISNFSDFRTKKQRSIFHTLAKRSHVYIFNSFTDRTHAYDIISRSNQSSVDILCISCKVISFHILWSACVANRSRQYLNLVQSKPLNILWISCKSNLRLFFANCTRVCFLFSCKPDLCLPFFLLLYKPDHFYIWPSLEPNLCLRKYT